MHDGQNRKMGEKKQAVLGGWERQFLRWSEGGAAPLLVGLPETFRSLLSHKASAAGRDTHLGQVLPHDLDEVGHGEVHDVVPPGRLQHHVGPQQVVAGEEAGGEALLLVLLQEPRQQLLRQLRVFGLGRVLHGILGKRQRLGV